VGIYDGSIPRAAAARRGGGGWVTARFLRAVGCGPRAPCRCLAALPTGCGWRARVVAPSCWPRPVDHDHERSRLAVRHDVRWAARGVRGYVDVRHQVTGGNWEGRSDGWFSLW
jgi:hypothetical protein